MKGKKQTNKNKCLITAITLRFSPGHYWYFTKKKSSRSTFLLPSGDGFQNTASIDIPSRTNLGNNLFFFSLIIYITWHSSSLQSQLSHCFACKKRIQHSKGISYGHVWENNGGNGAYPQILHCTWNIFCGIKTGGRSWIKVVKLGEPINVTYNKNITLKTNYQI